MQSRLTGRWRAALAAGAIAALAAVAAVLVADGAIWGGLAASGNAPLPPNPGCVRAGACREIQLTDARSPAPAAKVVIADGMAWLIRPATPSHPVAVGQVPS
jgi:hypothetical protein